jgi:amino acid transporter
MDYFVKAYHLVPSETQTLISALGRQVFGDGFLYYFLQIATLLILLLAANTSVADFPRLTYFVARDGFLPRQLAILGDRLVYSNGIRLLSLALVIVLSLLPVSVGLVFLYYLFPNSKLPSRK